MCWFVKKLQQRACFFHPYFDPQATLYVWIQNLWGSKKKASLFRETWRAHLFVVSWHGRSCQEMCGAMLRTGEQKAPAIVQSYNSMHWWPSIQRRRIGILKNCQKYALKLSWNVCIWHALVDQTFYGQWTNLHDRLPNWPELVINAWFVWFLTSITHVNLSNIVCTTVQVGSVSGLWLCQRCWRLKIDFRKKFVHIWKSQVCSHELDV